MLHSFYKLFIFDVMWTPGKRTVGLDHPETSCNQTGYS